MKKTVLIFMIGAIISACTTDQNPFFEAYKTSYQIPPFEKIKTEHYLPAFIEGIAQQRAEIDAIDRKSTRLNSSH